MTRVIPNTLHATMTAQGNPWVTVAGSASLPISQIASVEIVSASDAHVLLQRKLSTA
jgi:hypothetical protein